MRKSTLPSAGRWSRNQREWWVSAACEPKRKKSSSPMRATENSPTMRPCGLSIGVRTMRPTFGSRLVNSPCSQPAAPGPETRYLAKFDVSVSPTRSRTAWHSSATSGKAFERRKVTSSSGGRPGRWNQSACSRPNDRAPHGVVPVEAIVHRGHVERPRRGQLLVGERDPEAAAVVLPHLRVGVGEGGVVAVAGDVHAPDVQAGVALGHPRRRARGRRRRPGRARPSPRRPPSSCGCRGPGRPAGCRRART